jgi:hypothetical protein
VFTVLLAPWSTATWVSQVRSTAPYSQVRSTAPYSYESGSSIANHHWYKALRKRVERSNWCGASVRTRNVGGAGCDMHRLRPDQGTQFVCTDLWHEDRSLRAVPGLSEPASSRALSLQSCGACRRDCAEPADEGPPALSQAIRRSRFSARPGTSSASRWAKSKATRCQRRCERRNSRSPGAISSSRSQADHRSTGGGAGRVVQGSHDAG